MNLDLNTAIAVREREDGLLEKDTFDLATAMPVEDTISMDRNARYSPPADKDRATVELVYKEAGKKVPMGLKADWVLTSETAKMATKNIIGTIATGGIIPAYNALKGIANAESPNSDIGKMIFDSAYKGLAENEKVDNLGGAAAKAYPDAPWQITGAMGALAEVLMFMPGVVNTGAELLSKDTQFAIALNSARQSPKWGDLINTVSKKVNQPVEVVDQALYNKLWSIRGEADYFKVLNGNLKKTTGIDLFSEVGSIPIKRAKIGQVVNFTDPQGLIRTGTIKEITGERAIIDLEGNEIVATLSQLSLPEAPKVPEIKPKEAQGEAIEPKAISEGLPLAIRLKSGEVISDATAKLHSDIVTAKGINPDDVVDVGYMEKPVANKMGESLWHETNSQGLEYLMSYSDASGLNVSTDKSLALGQGGKGILVELNKDVLLGDRGSLATIKKPGTDFVGQKEFRLIGGENKPGTIKSITIQKDIPISKVQKGILNRDYDKVINEDKSITFTPKQTQGKYIPTKLPDTKGGAPLETLPEVPAELMDKVRASVSEKIAGQTEEIPSSPQSLKENIETPVGLSSVESMTPENNPVKKIIEAIKEAKDIRGKQETLYSKARKEKLAKMSAVGQKVSGQKGYYARLGALKGELPKVEFESIKNNLKQEDIDSLFDMIKTSPNLSEWDKLSAFEGLNNILGQTGGRVPTETQIKFLHKTFGKEFTDTLLEKRPLFAKMKEAGLQIANLPRSLMSSFFDLSFGFRQGVFFAPRYRKEFFDSFLKQFKWFASENAFKEAMINVSENSNYDLAIESGVSFTEMDSLMTEREEKYASQWAEKIPLIGKGVRATSRAYTAFANKLRMDTFSRLVQDAEKLGLNPRENMDLTKAIAGFVNNGTGRGSLGGFEKYAQALNAFFFSPRLMASRLNLLNLTQYINQDPFVRKEMLKTLLTFIGTGATILTLAKLMGADVGIDPRSSDFGKIKIGNTRIDIWGGFQQYARMAGQIISGKYVSSTTGKEMTLGEGYKPLTRLDILLRQIESKEAPIFSFMTDILKGQDFEGKPVNIPKEIGTRFVPMVVQDLYDVIKDNPEATPAVMLAPFGVGVQTYKGNPPKEKKRKTNFRN